MIHNKCEILVITTELKNCGKNANVSNTVHAYTVEIVKVIV